ncbi:MAG: YCF48-related protein [bacterium]
MRILFRYFSLFLISSISFGVSQSAYIIFTAQENIRIEEALKTNCLLLLEENKAVLISNNHVPPISINGIYEIYGPISEDTGLYYIHNPFNIDLSDITTLSRYKIDISDEKFIITGTGSIDEECRNRGAESYKLIPYKTSLNISFEPPDINYNPLIDSVIERVSSSENKKIVEHLASIPTRYSYSSNINVATYFIKDRLRGWGYDTRLFDYQYSLQDQCWIEDIHCLGDRSEFWFPMRAGYVFNSDDYGLSFDRSQCKILATAIFFLNDKKGWIAGYQKQISKTDDGVMWRTIDTGLNYRFSDIYFINENTGFMTTRDGYIVKTDDGGEKWNIIYNDTTNSLFSITFTDSLHGFACGGGTTLLISDDGGNTWNKEDLPVGDFVFRKIYFFNQNEGWIVGSGGVILHTFDGGKHWEIKRQDNDYLLSIDFIDSNEGWCCGTNGVILHTIDGGNTWISQESGTKDSYLFGIVALGDGNAFCVGTGQILRTDDSGNNWKKVDLGEFGKLTWKNIIASKVGTECPDEEIILIAHYDSISDLPWEKAPGADDNASGTSAVLTIAKTLQDIETKRTFRYLLVSGEEQGLWGSRAYARWARDAGMNIIAVLNMDMIAYLDDKIYDIDIAYNELYKWLGDYIFEVGELYLPELEKYLRTGGGGSDHIPFWENGYPATLTIEHAGSHWNPYYHKTTDLPEYLDFDFQSYVVKLITATALTLAEPVRISTPSEKKEIVIFPNPFVSSNTITPGIIFTGLSNYRTISIYSILGDKIDEILIDGKDSVLWEISNLNNISSGIYIWVASGDNKIEKGKIAVIK